MPLGVPIICLVTDSRRLAHPQDDALVRLVRHAAAAGVDLIHVREPHRTDADLVALTRRLVSAVGQTNTLVVVNDRVDVAIAAGAHGVHLRADSFSGDRVRRIAPPGFLIGRSVHGEDEAVAARSGVDYLVFGTVYPTISKPGLAVPAGIAGLRAVCRRVSVPVLAIGGISSDNVGELAAAGAAGVAAIGLFTEALNETSHGSHGSNEHLDAALGRLVAAVRRGFPPGPPAE